MTKILLVEDEKLFAKSVLRRLQAEGYQGQIAGSLSEAETWLADDSFDLIMLDVRLPDGNGLDLLASLRESEPGYQAIPVIVMTAYGELEDAVTAMKLGASDYLKKPVDLNELVLTVDKVMRARQISQQLHYSAVRSQQDNEPVQLIGTSDGIRQFGSQILQMATMMDNPDSTYPVLLLSGETGTGKDLAARFFHQSGNWHNEPFVQVECAALPTDRAETDLFGVAANVYPGNYIAQPGLIEAAESGTLFLDEISALSLSVQAKLLNVLERRTFRRVGDRQEYPVNAHIVVASNQNLADCVQAGSFRSDLYYRLNALEQTLPPLRSRQQDIPELAEYFIGIFARRYRVTAPGLSADALQQLQQYSWPGNVRELQHVLERAVMLSKTNGIGSSDLMLKPNPVGSDISLSSLLQDMTLEQVEKYLLSKSLEQTAGNVSKSARQLGLSRMAMRYRMEKYKL